MTCKAGRRRGDVERAAKNRIKKSQEIQKEEEEGRAHGEVCTVGHVVSIDDVGRGRDTVLDSAVLQCVVAQYTQWTFSNAGSLQLLVEVSWIVRVCLCGRDAKNKSPRACNIQSLPPRQLTAAKMCICLCID